LNPCYVEAFPTGVEPVTFGSGGALWDQPKSLKSREISPILAVEIPNAIVIKNRHSWASPGVVADLPQAVRIRTDQEQDEAV